jgi:hypothetical protein
LNIKDIFLFEFYNLSLFYNKLAINNPENLITSNYAKKLKMQINNGDIRLNQKLRSFIFYLFYAFIKFVKTY